MCINYKGAIPITKNIIVVDQFGKEYTSTYAKRAKGLVKNGRARWLDGNTICLVCPPDTLDLEEHNMSNKADQMEPTNVVCENKELTNEKATVTVTDILQRIDMIIAQGNQLQDVVIQIQNLPVNDSPYGGEDGAARAKAISSIYSAREVTNQKTIELLNKIYHDIAPKSISSVDARVKAAEKLANMNFAGVEPKTAEAVLEFMSKSLV